jgi:hypothetical protein
MVAGGALGAAAVGLSACEPAGVDLVVTSDGDGGDAVPGDGVCEVTAGVGDCTLRAAIDEANVLPDHETITFSENVSSLYVLGEGDDTNGTGDLDILDGVTIDGGAAGVAVEGTEADRVFDVHGGEPAPFVNFRNLTIRGGNADVGAGVRVTGPQQTTIDRSLVSGNMAGGAGGGLHVGAGATVSVVHSTFAVNGTDGGGAAIWSEGTVTLSYSTVAESWSAGAGAVERDPAATGPLNLLASVVGVQDGSVGCAGLITSLGANVAADSTCGLAAAGDLQGVDPLLGALGDNGGPTETYLPYQDSPAVDAVDAAGSGCGSLFATDARGIDRPQHGDCDAGAVEVEYLPMEIGNRANYLGTGDDPTNMLPLSQTENWFLAVSGPCSSAENGDLVSAVTDANAYFSPAPTDQNPGPTTGDTRWNRCTGATAQGTTEVNTNHDPHGYFYAVDVDPSRAGQPLNIEIYDAAHCHHYDAIAVSLDSNADTDVNRRFVTRYRLRAPDATVDPIDNPLVAGADLSLTSATNSGVCSLASSLTAGGYRNGWRRIARVPSAQAGRYFVQVNTELSPSTPADAMHGSNGFSLRAHHGTFTPCSADPATTGVYDPACPAIQAVEWAPALANLATAYAAVSLGLLPADSDGGLLEVQLWDPGEGALGMEVLDPLGRSVSFGWAVVDRSGYDVAPTGDWTGTVAQAGDVPCELFPTQCSSLDLLGLDPLATGRGWNPQPGPYRASRSKYNDRLLELGTVLPDDLQDQYGDARRIVIRYHTGTAPTDRTMWRAGVWEVGTAPTGT